MPKNRDTGRTKGIAFVTMASEEERDAAIAGMNEKELDGRMVYVDKAKPRGAASEKKEEGMLCYVTLRYVHLIISLDFE